MCYASLCAVLKERPSVGEGSQKHVRLLKGSRSSVLSDDPFGECRTLGTVSL